MKSILPNMSKDSRAMFQAQMQDQNLHDVMQCTEEDLCIHVHPAEITASEWTNQDRVIVIVVVVVAVAAGEVVYTFCTQGE